MPDNKITDLNALNERPAPDDFYVLVDKSNTTQSAEGSTVHALHHEIANRTIKQLGISLLGIDPDLPELNQVAEAINSGPAFTVHPNEDFELFTQYYGGGLTDGLLRSYYKLKNGWGNYGSGNPPITGLDLIKDRSEVSPVNTFDLGIIPVNVYLFVNTSGPYLVQGLTAFLSNESGEDKIYLFNGPDDLYGSGATLTTAANFIDLSDEPEAVLSDFYHRVKKIKTDYTLKNTDNRNIIEVLKTGADNAINITIPLHATEKIATGFVVELNQTIEDKTPTFTIESGVVVNTVFAKSLRFLGLNHGIKLTKIDINEWRADSLRGNYGAANSDNVDLVIPGIMYNQSTPTTGATITVDSVVLGGEAQTAIDTTGATDFPTIVDGTGEALTFQLLTGDDFVADETFDLFFRYNGAAVQYMFIKQ